MRWSAWRDVLLGCLVAMIAAGAAGCRRRVAEQPRWVTTGFPTEGMSCDGCERAIQAAVGKLDGVRAVKASRVQKRTDVTFDASRLRPEQIVAAINKLGYHAGLSAPPAR
jgi:copper chaperone CopZ